MNFEKLAGQTFDEALVDVAARVVAVKHIGPFEKTAGIGDMFETAKTNVGDWWNKQDPMLQKSLIGGGLGAVGGTLLGGAASAASGRPRPLRNALFSGLLGAGLGAAGGAALQAGLNNHAAGDQARKLQEAGSALTDYNKTQESNPATAVANGDVIGATEKTLNAVGNGGKAVVESPKARAAVVDSALLGGGGGAMVGAAAGRRLSPPVSTGGAPMVDANRVADLLKEPKNGLTAADFSKPTTIKHMVGGKLQSAQAQLPLTAASKGEALLQPMKRPVLPALKGGLIGSGVGSLAGGLIGLGREGVEHGGDPTLKAQQAGEAWLNLHPDLYNDDAKALFPNWKPAGAATTPAPESARATLQYLLGEYRKHLQQKQGGWASSLGAGIGTLASQAADLPGKAQAWWGRQDPNTQHALMGAGIGAVGGAATGLLAPRRKATTAGLLGLLGGAAGAAGGYYLGQPAAPSPPKTPTLEEPPAAGTPTAAAPAVTPGTTSTETTPITLAKDHPYIAGAGAGLAAAKGISTIKGLASMRSPVPRLISKATPGKAP